MSDALYLGIMSGTSLDGVDVALVSLKDNLHQLVAYYSHPLEDVFKKALIDLCSPGNNEIERMSEADRKLGEQFAIACLHLLEREKILARDIIAIGSHGQTIRHQPTGQYPFTLQIGDPNTIAARTGITTVADFRRRDIVIGGQGAPLAPAFHHAAFFDSTSHRVVLNIGGIANITDLRDEKHVTGFDTGPGNRLMDDWIALMQGKPYDHNGQWAASGSCHSALLDTLLADPYFQLLPPKSTGREDFHLAWLQKHLENIDVKPEDVQATLAELTAISIANSINKNCDEIIVCGGGANNDYLMQRLQVLLPRQKIASSANYGIAPDWVEAVAFAWLAKQTIEHKPGNLPEVTGALHPAILGGIYL